MGLKHNHELFEMGYLVCGLVGVYDAAGIEVGGVPTDVDGTENIDLYGIAYHDAVFGQGSGCFKGIFKYPGMGLHAVALF